MTWRLSRSAFEQQKGEANRRAFKKIVFGSDPPGIIAYFGEEPIGWCSVAPRAQFPVLQRSRVLKPVDERPVWSVTCLFVARPFRRQGVSVQLLRAALRYARSRGAAVVEGYPVAPRTRLPDAFVWTGLPSAFLEAGFVEVARRSPTRPIMRAKIRSRA
jgi:GNAT superfamily N-acetyltransferase